MYTNTSNTYLLIYLKLHKDEIFQKMKLLPDLPVMVMLLRKATYYCSHEKNKTNSLQKHLYIQLLINNNSISMREMDSANTTYANGNVYTNRH